MLLPLQWQAHHLQYRRIKVRADDWYVADRSLLALLRPVDDQRFANAALVEPAFAASQWKVGCRKGLVQAIGCNHAFGISKVSARHAAVVGEQDHDRVVIEAERLQFGKQAAEAFIDRLHHGGKLNVVLMLFDFDRAIGQDAVARPVRIAAFGSSTLGGTKGAVHPGCLRE